MLSIENWEQTAVYNPSDPTQKKIEKYAGVPGAYASFYFNRVPVNGALQGPTPFLDGMRGPTPFLDGLRGPTPFLDGPFSSAFSTGAGVFLGILAASLAVSGGTWALRRAGVIKKPSGVSGLGFFKFKRTRKLFRKIKRRR